MQRPWFGLSLVRSGLHEYHYFLCLLANKHATAACGVQVLQLTQAGVERAVGSSLVVMRTDRFNDQDRNNL